MATKHQVSVRLTHQFADGWAHEDEWRRVATFTVLPARLVEKPRANDEAGTYIVHVISPRPITSKREMDRIRAALADTFSGSSCRHEHDCCGCKSTWARVVHNDRRRFVLRLRITRNF
jgi:hypothetical protein